MNTYIKAAVLLSVFCSLFCSASFASVLVGVDFDSGYVAGSLIGQSGSSDVGLSDAFSSGAASATATVVSSSAGGSDLTYVVQGGGTISGGANCVNVSGAYGVTQDVFHRALGSNISGRPLYMRVVIRGETPITNSTFFRFYLAPAAPASNAMGGTGGAAFGLRDASGAVSPPGANAMMNNGTTSFSANTGAGVLTTGAVNLLVAKFNWNSITGKYDRVSIWVNPSAAASETPLASIDVTPFAPGALSVIGLGIINFGNGQTIAMDSLAIGTRWTDVVPGPADPNLVFSDTFDNDSRTDSDFEIDAWQFQTPQASTAIEGGGDLVQTAEAADSSTVITSASSAVGQRFNFFDRQLKFGATVRMGPSNATDTTNRRGRFTLASEGGGGVASPDTFSLLFFVENAVKLDAKVDFPNVDPNTTSVFISPKITTANAGSAASFPYFNYNHNFHLTVDAKRYRLVTNVSSTGSIRARFSGEHGIERSKWGANGDSALILEAMRTGAAAGTSATASWETLRVEANSEPLLNEPFWDFDVALTNVSGTSLNTKFRLWLPSTEPVIRGIIIVGPGTGLDYRCFALDPMVQEAARAIGFGIMAYSALDSNFTSNLAGASALAQSTIQAVLTRAADVSAHPEIANAPVCFTGFSLGGYDAVNMAKSWPERTVAYVAQHYGNSPPANPASALLKVPGLFVAGSTDWTTGSVQTWFANWRSKGAQVAFVVDWGVDHNLTGNQGWEATWTWLIESSNLRYPRPLVPGTMPGQIPSLVSVPDEAGWLGDNITTAPALVANAFIAVAPHDDYQGTRLSASWYPNETCARTYRALTSSDMVSRSAIPKQLPLNIVSPPQYGDQVTIGKPVPIVVDPREFDDIRGITAMEFYDGSILLGTDTSGPEWSLSFTPNTSGLHSLTVVATDTAGNKSSALRPLFVAPTDYAPIALAQVLEAPGGAEISGTLTGSDPEGEPVTFSIMDFPAHGLLDLDPVTGGYTYRPAHGFAGSDGFSFQVAGGSNAGPAVPVTFQVTPVLDSDSDGMPDAWETLHEVSTPADDDDGDGASNLQEYLAFTDPHDGADFFHAELTGEGTMAGSIHLQWPAKGGVRYRVQYSNDLAGFLDIPRPVTQEIQAGAYGASSNASFTDDYTLTPEPVGGKRFYRVRTDK